MTRVDNTLSSSSIVDSKKKKKMETTKAKTKTTTTKKTTKKRKRATDDDAATTPNENDGDSDAATNIPSGIEQQPKVSPEPIVSTSLSSNTKPLSSPSSSLIDEQTKPSPTGSTRKRKKKE